MLKDEFSHTALLGGGHAMGVGEAQRIEPKLGFGISSLHMHMRWLVPLVAVEEETKALDLEQGGHDFEGLSSGLFPRSIVRPRPWVGLLHDRLEVGDGNAGVDLGGLQAFVSEEFLDFADVGAAPEEMSGERMPEDVRGDGSFDPRLPGTLMHDGIDHGLSEAVSKLIEKEGRFTRTLQELRPSLSQVVVEHECRAAGQRDNSVFPALAIADEEKPLAEIDVGEVDATTLGETDSSSIEQFEDGAITSAVDAPSKRRLDEPRCFTLRQNESRQGHNPREFQAIGGILKHQMALHEIGKEAPQGGQVCPL